MPTKINYKTASTLSAPTLFLSWSGEYGKHVAEELANWLPLVLPQIKPWVSTSGIETGRNFFNELTEQVKSSVACLICVTQDTPYSTWVAFETGLAYANTKCLVCPVVFSGLNLSQSGPLHHLQLRQATLDGITQMLTDVVEHLKIIDNLLKSRVAQSWHILSDRLIQLEQRFAFIQNGFPQHTLNLFPTLENRKIDLVLSNAILQSSTTLDVLALTYATLSQSIKTMRFPNLTEVRLKTYAVPNQKHTHPVHQDNYPALVDEWVQCITSVIISFCNPERCPKLETIDFILLSTTPDFTGTIACWRDGNHFGSRIRMTLCVNGMPPDDLPTFIVDEDPRQSTQSFSQFLHLFRSTGQKPACPLTFKLSPQQCSEHFISRFVEQAATVTNHPGSMGQNDRLSPLALRNFQILADQSIKILQPGEVPRLCDWPISQSSEPPRQKWSVEIDGAGNPFVLNLPDQFAADILVPHFFANFVALLSPTNRGFDIVLMNHRKPPWDYDVPGGKYSSVDKSPELSVCREVFEELGWLLDVKNIKGPVGLVYDPRSAREAGNPGLIQYYYYILDAHIDCHCGELIPKKSTKGHLLTFTNIDDLIHEKKRKARPHQPNECLCHFPLKILEAIASELKRLSERPS